MKKQKGRVVNSQQSYFKKRIFERHCFELGSDKAISNRNVGKEMNYCTGIPKSLSKSSASLASTLATSSIGPSKVS